LQKKKNCQIKFKARKLELKRNKGPWRLLIGKPFWSFPLIAAMCKVKLAMCPDILSESKPVSFVVSLQMGPQVINPGYLKKVALPEKHRCGREVKLAIEIACQILSLYPNPEKSRICSSYRKRDVVKLVRHSHI
jgi:hypothetical protein